MISEKTKIVDEEKTRKVIELKRWLEDDCGFKPMWFRDKIICKKVSANHISGSFIECVEVFLRKIHRDSWSYITCSEENELFLHCIIGGRIRDYGFLENYHPTFKRVKTLKSEVKNAN